MPNNNGKQNIFKRYFTNFGLKQMCDILMLIGALTLIAGMFTAIGTVNAAKIIIAIGMGIYIVATVIALILSFNVLFSKINKRSPEYKRALANAIIMGVLLIVAIFGFVWALVNPISYV